MKIDGEHNKDVCVHFGRIVRIWLLLFIIMMPICIGAVAIGYANPTSRIIAQTYSYDRDSQSLMVLDIHRNLPIKFDFPVDVLGNIGLSGDGQRVILPTGAFNQAYFVLWDILTGRIMRLPDLYINCAARNWQWLRDNRHVVFQCRNNPLDGSIGGMYTMDFETGNVYQIFHLPNVIMDYQWSPDSQRVAINDDGKVHVVDVNGENLTTITPQGRRFTVIGWQPDGAGIFLQGLRGIELYRFDTGELDVLLADFSVNLPPILSPNGEWIILVKAERLAQAYAFHIASRELYLLETTDQKINRVDFVGWSPDSQWVIIRTPLSSGSGNVYYLARPDGSAIISIGENIEAPPIWASDHTRIAYEIYDTLGPTYYSEVVIWDLSSFLPPQTLMRDTHTPQWSPDGDGLAFIHYPQRQRLVYMNGNGEKYFLTDDSISVLVFMFIR